ncbi:MAG TPA: hypothetical protein VE057_04505 [Archangium sp.]|jgi:hypothetical protein|nr:hypothetical protein [Archangium sp.]
MQHHTQPFSFEESPDSPLLQEGQEPIRLAVTALQYTDGRVELELHATYMLPVDVAMRYGNLNEAWVVVVNDVDQRDGFAVSTFNDFVEFAEPRGPNLQSPPPLPLAPRGSMQSSGFQGGWVNGAMTFQAAPPAHRPSVYLYMVLENYVSNVVGLDLFDQRVVAF